MLKPRQHQQVRANPPNHLPGPQPFVDASICLCMCDSSLEKSWSTTQASCIFGSCRRVVNFCCWLRGLVHQFHHQPRSQNLRCICMFFNAFSLLKYLSHLPVLFDYVHPAVWHGVEVPRLWFPDLRHAGRLFGCKNGQILWIRTAQIQIATHDSS